MQFDVAEQDVGRQVRSLPAHERHEHDAPRNDHTDRDRTPDALRTSVRDLLDTATRLQNPVPVLSGKGLARC